MATTLSNPDGGDTLFVLVPSEVYEPADTATGAGVADGVEEHGPSEWVQRVLVKRKSVDLGRVKADLDKIQAQARHLLGSLSIRELGGMRLEGVQLSLGITAEGSLGIVTAGVEAAIDLTYRQVDAVPDPTPQPGQSTIRTPLAAAANEEPRLEGPRFA